MDLNRIIPNNGEWKVSKNRVFKKNIAWIPVFDIVDNNLIHIFLDLKMYKDVLKVVKNLQKTDIEFYFISPLFADPGFQGIVTKWRTEFTILLDYNEVNINNYLRCYSKPQFYDGFKKIEFDIIGNLIEYSKKEKCTELIKDIYLKVNKEVQKKVWDFYTNKQYFENKRPDIREDFNSLYREIQLQQILK